MSNKINFSNKCFDSKMPRVGGGALMGGIVNWPTTPEGISLTLLMSLPTDFLNNHGDFYLPAGCYVSVFSYYSKDDYFLDYITYHGNQEELTLLQKGYTQVFLHSEGSEISEGGKIPAMSIDVGQAIINDGDNFQGSKVGGKCCFLQSEKMSLSDKKFALQIHGGDFPKPYQDVLFLCDAVGYLFINNDLVLPGTFSNAGLFFVQVT